MEKQTQKVLAATAVAAGCLVLGGIAGAALFPQVVEVPGKEVIKTVTVDVPYVVEKNVTVEVPVEKIVTVEVENKDMSFVCARLEDKAVIEDAADCVAELKAEDEALDLAVQEVKDELASEMEDAGIVDDEDDVTVDKVYSDYEDVEFLDSDFEDKDYMIQFEVKVEDDDLDEDYKVLVKVRVEDSKAEIKSVTKIV
jgi:hypothetical protein